MHQQYPNNRPPPSLFMVAVIATGLVWWSMNLNPPMVNGHIDGFSALIHFMAGLFCLHTVIQLLENLSNLIDFLSSRRPTGQHGTAA